MVPDVQAGVELVMVCDIEVSIWEVPKGVSIIKKKVTVKESDLLHADLHVNSQNIIETPTQRSRL